MENKKEDVDILSDAHITPAVSSEMIEDNAGPRENDNDDENMINDDDDITNDDDDEGEIFGDENDDDDDETDPDSSIHKNSKENSF